LCEASRNVARARAIDVCARLSACELPLGGSAPGACLATALLAYDCSATPNRRLRGVALDRWTCLANAATCDAVDACVFPRAVPKCVSSGGEFTACGTPGQEATRVDCSATSQRGYGDPCETRGQVCRAHNTSQ